MTIKNEKPYKISIKVTSPSGEIIFLNRTWFWNNLKDLWDIMDCYKDWIQEHVNKHELNNSAQNEN